MIVDNFKVHNISFKKKSWLSWGVHSIEHDIMQHVAPPKNVGVALYFSICHLWGY